MMDKDGRCQAAAERQDPCDQASKCLFAVEPPHCWQDSVDLANLWWPHVCNGGSDG
jgi:hypothetical protein